MSSYLLLSLSKNTNKTEDIEIGFGTFSEVVTSHIEKIDRVTVPVPSYHKLDIDTLIFPENTSVTIDTPIVVKRLKCFSSPDKVGRFPEYFIRELLFHRLFDRHLAIPALIQVSFDEYKPQLVMVNGGTTLAKCIYEKDNQVVKGNHIKSLLYQLLCIVADIHANGWIHRDVKPGNILLNFNESNKISIQLCDFGSSKPFNSRNNAGNTDYVCTAGYRAPELLQGEQHYGPAVDLWSVGAVFYELLACDDLVPTWVTDPGENNLDILEYLVDKLEAEVVTDSNTITSDETHLLQKLLAVNPANRITAVDALNHPYFNDLLENNNNNNELSSDTPFKIVTQPTISLNNDILKQHDKLKLKHIMREHEHLQIMGELFELQDVTVRTAINMLNIYLVKTTGVNATKHIKLLAVAALYIANAIYETEFLTYQDILENIPTSSNEIFTWQDIDMYVQLIIFHLEGVLI